MRVLGVLLLALIAGQGCYHNRPVTVATVRPTPRVLLQSRDGVLLRTPRADGSIALGGCAVTKAYATLWDVEGDTLMLQQVDILSRARGSATCVLPETGVVAVIAQPGLALSVVQASPERSFLAGLLAGPVVVFLILAAMWN